MPNSSTSVARRYGLAVAAIAAAIAARWALAPWLGLTFPLATMFTAVSFVVWRAGWGPALFTAIVGWAAAGFAFRGGLQFFDGVTLTETLGFLTYLIATVPIVVLGEAMHRAQRALETEHRALASTNVELEHTIEAQKAWEQQLVRNEEAQRLLVGIHDATRGLEDSALVMRETVTRVGLHFDVTRCAYGEVDLDQKHLEITRGYTKNLPTAAGRYPLDAFGPELIKELIAGRTAIIKDVTTDPLTATPAARALYAKLRVSSMVCVPISRRGKLVAILVMCDSQPRLWRAEEARLLEQVAERTLFAVESARAAQALREHRDVMHLAMRTARMGAWTRDLLLDTVWWSPEFAELLGFDAGDTNYDRQRLFAQLRPEDRARLPQIIEQAIGDRRDYLVEFEIQHALTGEWRWMQARGRAEYDADGRPVKLFGLAIDITDSRRSVEALQEADRRKDEFLATLAHELRNPLAPINSGLHILRSAKDPAQTGAALDIMERQLRQMVRLVDDLLDVARITTGKVEIRREPIDLWAAVNDAVETCQPIFTQTRQQFSMQRPSDPVFVNADRTRLAQVFANLLNNSAKYSEPGQSISLTIAVEKDAATVRVRDSGIGIHPEMLPRVFEMFRQADRTGGRSRGGLGIGLSLVKRIVEMHGGTVTAVSEGLGRGCEFTVRLPVIDVQRIEAARDGLGANAARTRRKILVVDDNADAAESLAALLSIGGHETRMAHDGRAAVTEAEQFHPDVVFLDIGMPVIDGHEAAKMIRQQPWGRNMVLVALTGWGQSEDRRRSKDAGFNHHLVKPADPSALAKLLASLGS